MIALAKIAKRNKDVADVNADEALTTVKGSVVRQDSNCEVVQYISKGDQTVYERFLSINDVAERLNISTRSTWRLLARGELPKPVKIGNKISRFSSLELDDYIENLKQQRAK